MPRSRCVPQNKPVLVVSNVLRFFNNTRTPQTVTTDALHYRGPTDTILMWLAGLLTKPMGLLAPGWVCMRSPLWP
jgi:hypothetical protein